jgi:hypothetical protein
MKRFFICVFVASCASTYITDESQLQRRAAFDFACPEEQIVITKLDGRASFPNQWGASGCGQRAVYRCAKRDDTLNYPQGVCVWQREPFTLAGDGGS